MLIYGPTAGGLADQAPCTQVTVWDTGTWASKTTSDFAAFDAIVFGDEPACFGDPTPYNTAVANRDMWSRAVVGNVIIIGSDPDFHYKPQLVQQAVQFAASGNGTGLYVALSCAYNNVPTSSPVTVDLLGGLGTFVTRTSSCNNDVHKVADHPVLAGLDDTYLSNWSCSTHEAFDAWPQTYVPLAIAVDSPSSTDPGDWVAGDGTRGLVYMLVSGSNVGDAYQADQGLNCACDGSGSSTSGQVQPSFGGPFNSRTGNLWISATDLAVASSGPRLAWTRTYNSRATGFTDASGALGPGWTESYATRLITPGVPGGEPGVDIITSPTGNRLRFQDIGNGQFRPFPGVDATLAQVSGVYTETLRTRDQVIFDASGRATAMMDAQGRQLALQYDGTGRLARVQDMLNPARYLAVSYDPAGAHVASVRDGAGRSVGYTYDPTTGDLITATNTMGQPTTYGYTNHLLTGITDALGEPVERTSYDSYAPAGRVVAQTLQDGRQLAVDYEPAATTVTTTATDGRQDVTQVLYDAARNAAAGIVHNGVLVQQTEFDANFSPSLVEDADGNPTTILSNGLGLPTQVMNAAHGTSAVAYDPATGALPITLTDTMGRQTVDAYDASGNLISSTAGITTAFPLGQTTVYTYNVRYPGTNWLEDVRAPDGVVTHNEYDAAGQLTTQTVGYGTPQAQVTAFGYDAAGRPVTTTVDAGSPQQCTDIVRYNADDTIAQTIQDDTGSGVYDPAHSDQNVTTTYGYDALGRQTWRRDALGHYDLTHYDATGRVDWTLHNLAPVQLDGQGNPVIPATAPAFAPAQPGADVATLYGYDGFGRQTLVTQTGILTGTFSAATRVFSAATTRTTKVDYDTADRLITTTLDYQTGVAPSADTNVQTVAQYDGAGNVTAQRDALGRWTQTQYDALERPVTTTTNLENGDPTTVDPANASWTDGSDTDLVTVVRYNPDSTVAQRIDNYVDGVFTASKPITDRITQDDYDAEGRVVTSTINADPATVGSRADTNRQSATMYDPLTGRMLGERDALGRWTSLQYDALGRVVATVANCRDAAGAPIAQGCAPFSPAVQDRNVAAQTRYDALGRPFETVDALGHVAHMTYDGLDRAISTIDNYVAGAPATAGANVATGQAYDALGRTVAVTDALGDASLQSYNDLGASVTTTDAAGRASQAGYDATGERWSAAPDGRLTVTRVDGLGRVVATIRDYHTGAAAGAPADQDLTTQTLYDAAGRTIQMVDEAGRVTAYTYDLLDHVTSVTKNAQAACAAGAMDCNVVTRYAYDRAGHRVATTNPRGNTTRYTYDAADDQTAATDALTRTTSWDYDLGGRVVAQHDPRGPTDDLTFGYDGLDRLTGTSSPGLSAPIARQYDALGRRISLSDGAGTTSFAYDALGRTTAITAPNTGAIGYGYNADGARTGLTYPDGTALGYSYYPDGQLKAVTQGASTLASYSYDGNGRLQQAARANGAVSTYSYDGADRLLDLSTTINGAPRSDFQNGFDRLGERVAVTETVPLTATATPTATVPVSAVCALYPIALSAQTLAGVPVSTTISSIANGSGPGNFGWLSWTEDTSEGALATSLTPPGASASYVNPADATDHALVAGKTVWGRPGVSNSRAVRAALDQLETQDIVVPIWDTAAGGGSGATYHIAAFARVRLLDYRLPGANKISARFLGYASCGGGVPSPSGTPTPTATPTPLSATRAITYAYDGLQRLTDAVENPGTAYHYGYDLAGNRTDTSVNGTPATHQDYDAANQVIGWGYDAAGNVLTDTTRAYTYDALGRLMGLAAGAEQQSYAYNGDGTLVSRTVDLSTTTFAQDLAAPTSQVLAAQPAGGAPTDYLYGLDRLAGQAGATRTWYGADTQGSVRYATDDAGYTRAPRNYDPFGAPEAAPMPDLFGYTGELQDAATGLVDLRARWYNPAAGQFLARDPLEQTTGQAYAYAGNDPINEMDPSGLCGEWYDVFHRASPIDGKCVSVAVYWAQVYALTHSAQDRQNAVNTVNSIRDTYNQFTDAFYTAVQNGAADLYATGAEALRLAPPTGVILAGGWRNYEVYALTDLSQAAYSADHLDTGWSIVSQAIVRPYQLAIECPSASTIGTAVGDTAVQIVSLFGPAKALGLVRGIGGGSAADAASSASAASGANDFIDSGPTGRLGGQLYPVDKLQQLASYLARRGVALKVGDEHMLSSTMRGGFAKDGSELVLGSNPTYYEVWHELSHYLHFKSVGSKEAYMALPRWTPINPIQDVPEQFVFDMLENSPKRWNALTYEEQQDAIRYVEGKGGFR